MGEDVRHRNMKKRGNGGVTASDVSIFGSDGITGEVPRWRVD
jgi:hypothetical protein